MSKPSYISRMRALPLACMLALGLIGCAQSPETQLATPAAAAATPAKLSAEQRTAMLEAYFEQYWEEGLKRNPVQATFVGDNRYNDQLPNFFSESYRAEGLALAKQWLEKLDAIDVSDLEGQTRLSFEILHRSLLLELEGAKFRTDLMPLNQFNSIASAVAQMGSGSSAQPFKTVQDYDNWRKRASRVPELFAQMQSNMREGMKTGMVQPKVLMAKVVPQLDALITKDAESSLFWQPIKNLPKTISADDQSRLKREYQTLIGAELLPAFVELRRFVHDEYLPACRDSVGIDSLPNGKAIYAYLAKTSTTTELAPEEIHAIGLAEVARIHAEMRGVMQQVGFKGTLQAFFKFMDTDKQFQFKDEQTMLAGYNALRVKVDKEIPKLFSVTPKAGFEIRPIEAFRAQSAAGGEYQGPSEDGSRPGIFYVNTHDLPSRKTWDMEDLYLHEAIPGHHFQIAIAQELSGVPKFRRFGGDTAYVEGWALYTETLGRDLGVFTDPYMYFGGLQGELWRAIRLVVDTGIHSKSWTREQTIAYMRENSAVSETDAIAETERYMAIPGQALAYKIGQMKIRELRNRAEAQLGKDFDVRAFHDQILKDGSLPLSVLETKIDRWIASKKA